MKKRIGIAFAVLVLVFFAGGMVALQIAGEEWIKGISPDHSLTSMRPF